MGQSTSRLHRDSTTLTIRLDSKLYQSLLEEGKIKGISLNSLISNITERYVRWDKYAKEMAYISISKKTMKKFCNEIPEKKIIEFANDIGKNLLTQVTLLMFDEINFETIIKTIKIRTAQYGMVNHIVNGDKSHIFTIHHGINQKFSIFLSNVYQAMANNNSIACSVLNLQPDIFSMKLQEIK